MTDLVVGQLDALGLDYEVVECDPDLADTAAFCEAYGYAAQDSANAIVPAGKASFASADQTIELTGHARWASSGKGRRRPRQTFARGLELCNRVAHRHVAFGQHDDVDAPVPLDWV